ncbi:hypothetical protein [Parasitella parasitica]|uniref:Uncharacterized protein n=1 Tax=Parasitella parasitica TaxID=35722 RepID=A0A0B7NHQ4_9FUNG|nr:hypothetical protein [Parasitella parasitica]
MHLHNITTTDTSNNMTPEDGLDERWDGNLGYYHQANPNEQQKELALEVLLQQNLNIHQPLKEASPPLSVKSDGSINTACFREDLDEDYFECSNMNSPTVIQVDTVPTPSNTPPCSSAKVQHGSYLPPAFTKDDRKDDLSIVALNDLSPNECIAVLKQQEIQDAEFNEEHSKTMTTSMPAKTPPASLPEYHLDLVRYYTDALLRMTDPCMMQSIVSTLPAMYLDYISSLNLYSRS